MEKIGISVKLNCKNQGLEALIGYTIKDRFLIESALKHGSFGQVFLVWDLIDKRQLALKIQSDHGLMMEEYNSLKRINAIFNLNKEKLSSMNDKPFPEVVQVGNAHLYNLDSQNENEEDSQKYSFYIMTHFSMNLEQYLKKVSGIVFIKDVLEVAYQLIDILKLVHKAKRTFNDLKPENIMITPPSQSEKLKVHLIDFGCVDKFDRNKDEPIKEGEAEFVTEFKGNLLYASVNQMNFMRTSPKDDIISVFYLVVSSLND